MDRVLFAEIGSTALVTALLLSITYLIVYQMVRSHFSHLHRLVSRNYDLSARDSFTSNEDIYHLPLKGDVI
jgi:hypothetical protein